MTQSRPSRIGKYEVESVVGEGAMGVVYRAVDSMLNRQVAIKVMSDAIAQNSELRQRFLREAQAAGSLQHPNVVTVYDFGEVEGHLYIAMEYVDGEDLEDLLGAQIPFPLDAKLELIIGVLQGLAFAHKRGVIHRDIKPANIRVDKEGKARIMDFGVAHLASSDMTRTGTMLGTPSYMAPEQIVGGPVSEQTDIFSVGAVLYELLTNVRPFSGDSLQSLMYHILSTTPSPPGEVVPGLPPELDRIVMRALEKDAKLRYPQALEMANDLSVVRTAKGPHGIGTSLSLRATIDTAIAERHSGSLRALRRRRLTSSAASVLGAALLLGIGYAAWRMNVPAFTPGTGPPAAATAVASDDLPASTANRRGAPAPLSPSDSISPAGNPSIRADPSRTSPDPGAQTTAPAAKPPGMTVNEVALARSVQRAALEGRRRASEMGATPLQLSSGDGHNRAGEVLLGRGRTLEAATLFNRAAAAWRSAEQSARADASTRSVATSTGTPESFGMPAAAQAPRPSEPPVANLLLRSGSAAGAAPPSGPPALPRALSHPAPEIHAVIAAYARAIESRDIGELLRVYPGMSADQRRRFEDFFRATRSLRAAFPVSDLQVDGATAEARISGSYEYVTTAGKTEQRPNVFRATLRHDGSAWKLVAVR